MARPWRKRAVWAAGAAGVTAILVLLYANLTASSARVEHAIPHRYTPADSQFVRVMGSLLGPGMVQGNRVTTLLNGDQVFPAMLDAIRAARRRIRAAAGARVQPGQGPVTRGDAGGVGASAPQGTGAGAARPAGQIAALTAILRRDLESEVRT